MINELNQFNQIRVEARAYLTYLLTRNITNYLPEPDIKTITNGLKKIERENDSIDILYLLDAKGEQIIDNVSRHAEYRKGKGVNRSGRAYYYRALKDKRPIMTDPYPSLLTGGLCVSAACPIYDDKHQIKYVAVLDVSLENILKAVRPHWIDTGFTNVSKAVYGLFSVFLFAIAALLLVKGVDLLTYKGFKFHEVDLKDIFESTILMTLALAMFDLVKAIFEEEVLGRGKHHAGGSQIHRTMTRFLGSIIIAIAIEALMLVFKSTLIDPSKLIYAVYLLGGLTLLLFGLAFYIKFTSDSARDQR